MAILADMTYLPGGQTPFPRSYPAQVAFQWLPGITLVSGGNPWIFEEHAFGGYRIHIKFKDNFWLWTSNVYTLDYILEDVWVEAPGDPTPLFAGVTVLGFAVFGQTHWWGLGMSFNPSLGDYLIYTMPPPPPTYWLQPPPSAYPYIP